MLVGLFVRAALSGGCSKQQKALHALKVQVYCRPIPRHSLRLAGRMRRHLKQHAEVLRVRDVMEPACRAEKAGKREGEKLRD
eukprot:1982280-Pleurochrysis_carterae.AAC.2